MPSRIVLGGRQLGTGRYGGDPRCLCGEPARLLGRCTECHEALRRRRLGLPPNTEAEGKRLAAYLEKHKARSSVCAVCGAGNDVPHDGNCPWSEG